MQSTTLTPNGETVQHDVEITYNDNGQTCLHVISKLGDATHEHRVSIGATDGNDSVDIMEIEQLQAHIDSVRSRSAAILSNRARIASLAQQLQ